MSGTLEPLKPGEIAYWGDWQFTYSYEPGDHYVEWFQREDAVYATVNEDWELTATMPALLVARAAKWIEASAPHHEGGKVA